jgi:hypothetical protein
MATTNTGDLDGDGCIDLVIGDTSGHVYWSRNEGTKTSPKFSSRAPLMVGDAPVKVSHKSDPFAVDFDADGHVDLLVGDEVADVVWFRGKGDGTFHAGVSLFTRAPIDPKAGYGPAKAKLEPHRVVPGYRLRVTAVDWNLDGKLDLLIGNCATEPGEPMADGKPGRGTTVGHVYLLLQQ